MHFQQPLIRRRPYVPPRSGWNGPSPLGNQGSASQPPPRQHPVLSPVVASPMSAGGHRRTESENYYEDVDPRFAIEEASQVGGPQSPVPNSLMPGAGQPSNRYPSPQHLHPNSGSTEMLGNHNGSTPSLERDSSYENIAEGARSPAGSDASHFTSVSQRGINPNWRPAGGPGYGPGPNIGAGPGPGPAQRRNDAILNANPDFSIPGARPGRGGRGGLVAMNSGMGRGGLTPIGRYPSPTDI